MSLLSVRLANQPTGVSRVPDSPLQAKHQPTNAKLCFPRTERKSRGGDNDELDRQHNDEEEEEDRGWRGQRCLAEPYQDQEDQEKQEERAREGEHLRGEFSI